MYQIQETSYGLHVVFNGFLQKDEMMAWATEVMPIVNGRRGEFGALVDLRGAKAFPQAAQEVLFDAIKNLRSRGLNRQSVVVASPILKIQATRMAKELGMYEVVRFLDASALENWEEVGVDWAARGIDPD
jgi:hypothetical protein